MKKIYIKDIFLKIADFNLKIQFYHTDLKYLYNKVLKEITEIYAGFVLKEKPNNIDFLINFSDKQMMDMLTRITENKKYIAFYEKPKSTIINTYYQISNTQFQLILRDILLQLLNSDSGFIIHSSCVNINNQGYLFVGPSGSGKSTSQKLLNDVFPAIADDTVIIRRINIKYFCYQTPFIEKESWLKKDKTRFPIKSIFMLNKSPYFKIDFINNKDYILRSIIKQFWTEKQYEKKQMRILFEFVNSFNNFYHLHFAKDSQKLTRLIKHHDKQLTFSKKMKNHNNPLLQIKY